MRNCFVLLLVLIVFPLVGGPAEEAPTRVSFEVGIASWYGEPFHGRVAANGETYNMYELTAAHRGLPFGTYVRVTNPANGRSIVVRITDRGPFIDPRILDLSYAAARHLRIVRDGSAKVRLDLLRDVEDSSLASRFPIWPLPESSGLRADAGTLGGQVGD